MAIAGLSSGLLFGGVDVPENHYRRGQEAWRSKHSDHPRWHDILFWNLDHIWNGEKIRVWIEPCRIPVNLPEPLT